MARFNNSVTVPAADNNNRKWEAAAFVNFYLPGKDGTRKKLGAIPLRIANANEAALLNWLKEDPSRVATLLAKLEVDFREVASGDAAGFDL